MSDTRKWVKVSRSAKGEVTVRVSLQCDNISTNWTVRTFSNGIPDGVAEATRGAEKALNITIEAVGE